MNVVSSAPVIATRTEAGRVPHSRAWAMLRAFRSGRDTLEIARLEGLTEAAVCIVLHRMREVERAGGKPPAIPEKGGRLALIV
jgi:hypothetical protein